MKPLRSAASPRRPSARCRHNPVKSVASAAAAGGSSCDHRRAKGDPISFGNRPSRAGDDLEDAFTWKEERTLSQALTLQYDKVIFILEPSEQAKAAIGKRVTVVDYPDDRLSIRYNGVELAYRTFDKIRQVDHGAIADNKRLSAVLEQVKAQQAAYPARQQRGHVARQRPPNNLEAPGLPSKGRAPRHAAAAALT